MAQGLPVTDLILESVQVHLARHRRVQAAVDALLIHRTPLRYRLAKPEGHPGRKSCCALPW
jgi:sugar diacid utilization regulator